jgi:hypothetical protein
MRSRTVVLPHAIAAALACASCGRHDSPPAPSTSAEPRAPSAACAHAVCGDTFFVDAAPVTCAPGSPCTIALRLEATGGYHINDDYPYRFKADDAPGLELLGTDAAGKNVFSKTAGDWSKQAEKVGVMTVKVKPAAKGDAAVSGVFKLSVCSAEHCQLEQPNVRATVSVR